jgi:hypothetical protein
MPSVTIPYPAVSHNSRPRGKCAPRHAAAASITAPEIRYRTHTSVVGENDSSAMRMPRYVVPQKMHTQTSAT